MKIKSAEYLTTAVLKEQLPDYAFPEIAVVGRSNVGKSSLINRLANQKHLARTSGKPGKTRTINFFLFNQSFVLVDLPGYGYAKVPQHMKKQWGQMINNYLEDRPQLMTTVLLVDIRHKPSKEDLQMYDWLCASQEQVVIACTKRDKLSRGKWSVQMRMIAQALGKREQDILLALSSNNQEGIQDLLDLLGEIMAPLEEDGDQTREEEDNHDN